MGNVKDFTMVTDKFTKVDIVTVFSLAACTLAMMGVIIWLSSSPLPSSHVSNGSVTLPATTSTTSTTPTTTSPTTTPTTPRNNLTEARKEEWTLSLFEEYKLVSGRSLKLSTFKGLLREFLEYQKYKTNHKDSRLFPLNPTAANLNDFNRLRMDAQSAEDFFVKMKVLNGREGKYEKINEYEKWSRFRAHTTGQETARKLFRLREFEDLDKYVINNLVKNRCVNSEEEDVLRYFSMREMFLKTNDGSFQHDPEYMLARVKEAAKDLESSQKGHEDCFN